MSRRIISRLPDDNPRFKNSDISEYRPLALIQESPVTQQIREAAEAAEDFCQHEISIISSVASELTAQANNSSSSAQPSLHNLEEGEIASPSGSPQVRENVSEETMAAIGGERRRTLLCEVQRSFQWRRHRHFRPYVKHNRLLSRQHCYLALHPR